jgi:hypothetical protein
MLIRDTTFASTLIIYRVAGFTLHTTATSCLQSGQFALPPSAQAGQDLAPVTGSVKHTPSHSLQACVLPPLGKVALTQLGYPQP